MNKILALIVVGVGSIACNLGKVAPTIPEAPQAVPASETPPAIQPSPTQVPDAAQPAGELDPCSLLTAAEAEAILAQTVGAPNAMNGACIYSSSDGLYTVSATAAQDQQTSGILQGQAMLLGFAGGQLDEARMDKLKTMAAALDYKGFFTELAAAAEGSATLKAKLVEDGNSDVAYWAWITAQSRRQGAFVAVRGQTVVNINLVVTETQTEEAMLAASATLTEKIFGLLPAKFALAMPTSAPTQQAQVLPTPTEVLPVKTIVGSWERRSSEVTEYFNIQSDGSYSIEARKNSTNEVIASISGTLTYDQGNIYYVDKNNHKSTESFYLGNEGDLLVINGDTEKAWTRVK
jgi:hypothetical protein